MNIHLCLIIFCILTSACASRSSPEQNVQTMASAAPVVDASAHDPFEGYNRSVMKLNSGLTTIIIKPVISVYRLLLPGPLRAAIANISTNAKAPLVFVHDVLQGEGDRASQTLGRFLMNSTVGLAGAIDIAAKAGVPKHDEDAGQTLGRWGIPSGPYLMLPLLGPSSVRDAIGFAADMFVDPLRYVQRHNDVRNTIGTGLTIGSALSQVDQNIDRLGEVQRGSLDPYIALREAYRQYRQADINNGRPQAMKAEDDPLADILDEKP
jgi:phospholipid-binding lipoprotein MlaA